MILAFDTYYKGSEAKTVCVGFNDWEDLFPKYINHTKTYGVVEYESGSFFKRELPCILDLLSQNTNLQITLIVIDGYVYLDDLGSYGLGGHLYEKLGNKIPIIGVAKSNFAQINKLKIEIFRGISKKPLYITSIGLDLEIAAKYIKSMAGNNRIPDLLKLVDSLSKEN